MLITKHMLFVGFSLNDENFHRIMDAVRGAMPEAEKEKKERKDYQKEKKDQKVSSIYFDDVYFLVIFLTSSLLSPFPSVLPPLPFSEQL